MNKKKIETLLTVALIIIFVLAATRLFSAKNRKAVNRMMSKAVTKITAYTASKDKIETKLMQIKNKLDKITTERDPFIRGYSSNKSGSVSLDLTGIIWDAKDARAIIGEVVARKCS